MKAGTATKLVLNTLTTGAMIRLGKTYGNLMVDLRAWNDKLVDRSQRIVMETTGLDRDASRAVLDAAGGSVKTAIVMARRGVGREEAERLLAGARRPAPHHRRRSAAGAHRMTERPTLAIGLMSGTSLDGMDAALVRFHGPTHADLIDFVTRPYTDDERAELRARARRGRRADRSPACTSAWRSGRRRRWRRCSCRRRCRRRSWPSSRSTGQTIWHEPPTGHLAARRAGRPRRAVRRPGGEQLPRARRGGRRAGRAARADGGRAALRRAGRPARAAQPRRHGQPHLRRRARSQEDGVLAFDTGPGVAIIDGVARLVDRRRSYDRDGLIAAQGTAGRGRARRAAGRSVLLGTAAEEHRPRALRRRLRRARCTRGCPAPTASPPRSSSPRGASRRPSRRWTPAGTEVVASGGGCHHPGSWRRSSARLAASGGHALRRFDDLFFPGDAKEAVAFALLGYLTLHGQPGNVPAATGASGARVLGTVTPA